MKTSKPIIFCSLIVGGLLVIQTDAFARWGHHRHGRFGGDFSALENRERVQVLRRFHDHSKYHAVLNHSREEEDSSRFDVKKAPVSPEMIMLNNGVTRDVSIDNGQLTSISTRVLGIVNEDDVGAAHPESKTQQNQEQLKVETSCVHSPYTCTS